MQIVDNPRRHEANPVPKIKANEQLWNVLKLLGIFALLGMNAFLGYQIFT